MIDINWYAMLKYFEKYHEEINSYKNYKELRTDKDFDTLSHEKMNKYSLELNEINDIYIYQRLCYMYFNNYDENKVSKQIKLIQKCIRHRKLDNMVYS